MADTNATDAVSRRNVLKKGTLVSAGLLINGVTMNKTVEGHEGGVALLTNPGSWRLFHVRKDFEETFTLSADCIADGDYHRYQAQFWTRETPDTYIKRGQRSFLVPSDRQLTVSGTVTEDSNGTEVNENSFDPGVLHELHEVRSCEVETDKGPLKFRENWIQATSQPINRGS